jgi:hypothetical protein
MPRLNVETRTVHAICRHFAHKPEFELDSLSLARAIQSKLPGAVVIHGAAVYEGASPEACSWVRVGGKDYDVQRIAKMRRFGCFFALHHDKPGRCTDPAPGVRTLEEGEDQTHDPSPDTPRGHIKELEGWSLPACSACCGKCRAHTLDSECVSPWKAQTLHIRAMTALARTLKPYPFKDQPERWSFQAEE